MPMIIDRQVAVPTSNTVGHNASRISVVTGRLLTSDTPRLPCNVSRTYDANCSSFDPSRLNCSRNRSFCASDRLRPRYSVPTGSSLTTRNRKKLTTTTNASVPIEPTILPITNRGRTMRVLLAVVAVLARAHRQRRTHTENRDTAGDERDQHARAEACRRRRHCRPRRSA